MKKFITIIFLVFLTQSYAQETKSSGLEKGEQKDCSGRKKPPKAALDACVDMQTADYCEFEGRKGEVVTGSCFAPDSIMPLACKPERKEQ